MTVVAKAEPDPLRRPHPEPPSASAVRAWSHAIERAAVSRVAPIAALLFGVYYAALVPVHWLRMPEADRAAIAGLAALTSLVFGVLAFRWQFVARAERTSPVVITMASIMLVNNVHVLWRLPSPEYVTSHLLVLAGVGYLDVTWTAFWRFLLVAICAVAIGPLRAGFGPEWTEPAIYLGGTTVLAIAVRLYRSRTQELLDEARAESEQQRMAAEESLFALQHETVQREQLQDQLARAERLESLGVLAGGVAHDFNNLMAVVIGNASLALEREASEEARAELMAILEAGDRATLLSKSLLAYAGRGIRAVVPLDLAAEASAIADLAASSLPGGVSMEIDAPRDETFVSADRAQLQQVVLNLFMNAADASAASGGTIRVSVGRTELDADAARSLEPTGDRPAGEYATVRVTDRGEGMSAETLKRIFDPFFTTKPGGRGLGLAAALGIARAHGGGLQVTSEADAGSTFALVLPASSERPSPVSPVPRAGSLANGTILVVDDLESVRGMLARALRARGFRVVEAAGGLEACDRLREEGASVVAAVVDMSMPGMDGEQTLFALRGIDSTLPILLSSGFDVHAAAERLSDLPGIDFLPKPYRIAELLERIDALLPAS